MASESPTITFKSFRDQYAQAIIKDHHAKLQKRHGRYSQGLPKARKPLPRVEGKPLTVGILGAGAAGLYAGLLIDSLDTPDVTYTILEADPMKNRQGGGRLFTYNFPGGGVNDYYDIGAMRFPDIPFMKPVFDLIRDNPASPIAKELDLIKYYMDANNNLNLFNGVLLTDAEVTQAGKAGNYDPFNTGVSAPGTVGDMVGAALNTFKTGLVNDWQTGWQTLMAQDEYSTRDYMKFVNPKYTDQQINYLETFDSASNLYDCALSESVMDSLDFDYPDPNGVPWFCIQGGAGLIADKMHAALKIAQPQYGQRVTAIASNTVTGGIDVTVNGGSTPQNFSHVISTMTFGTLRMVDTTGCGFDWDTQAAIRALHYDCSVKVAIMFKSRWWEASNLVNGPHNGGVSSTDRPTRVVVYPSYGIGSTTGASIIVSYTWAQDAMRFGAYAGQDDKENYLLQCIFKDLADMHEVDYGYLWGLKETYSVFNWYDDEYTAGAFALFGPGQFSNLYPKVTAPVGGFFHFAGEATSAHHAWVVGAFNSAWRAVYQMLYAEDRSDLIKTLKEKWPEPSEWVGILPELETQVAIGQEMYRHFGRAAGR